MSGEILQPGEQHLGAAISTAELAAVDEGGGLTGVLSYSDVRDWECGHSGLTHQLGLLPVPKQDHIIVI